jgi:predicted dehydrogenase
MKKLSSKISVVIVGFGYWGKNLARVISGIPEVSIAGIIDPQISRSQADTGGRRIPVLRDMDTVLRDADVDAVIISSPARSHFTIAKAALIQNKHVFIEKPMTLSTRDAKTLVALAQKNKRVILVDHTYMYSDAVIQMKGMMDRGDIGPVYAMESVRMNWGTIRSDCSVVWDLAVHDIAVYRYFFGPPARVRTTGFHYGGAGFPRRATVCLENGCGVSGLFDVSWVYPTKVRRLTLLGTKGCLVMDETEEKGNIHMYQNGLAKKIMNPDDTRKEPLRRACEDFVGCIRKGGIPRVSGSDGAAVVSVLEAADRSLAREQGWEAL